MSPSPARDSRLAAEGPQCLLSESSGLCHSARCRCHYRRTDALSVCRALQSALPARERREGRVHFLLATSAPRGSEVLRRSDAAAKLAARTAVAGADGCRLPG